MYLFGSRGSSGAILDRWIADDRQSFGARKKLSTLDSAQRACLGRIAMDAYRNTGSRYRPSEKDLFAPRLQSGLDQPLEPNTFTW